MSRIAFIGDIHACHIELKELYSRLEWISVDEIWHTGDVIERGPSNADTVDFLIEKGIKGVRGNHESSILNHYDRVSKGGALPKNPAKVKALMDLNVVHMDYLRALPIAHIFDDINTVLVHGGMFPRSWIKPRYFEIYNLPDSVCRAQMIHPDKLGYNRWWGKDAAMHLSGKTEEQNRAEGWKRWYEDGVYDWTYNCVFGHSVFSQPFVKQNPGCGKTIGIDNGICFNGMLTACIMDESQEPWFVSVKAKQLWFELSHRIIVD